jgi:hypothetical protein
MVEQDGETAFVRQEGEQRYHSDPTSSLRATALIRHGSELVDGIFFTETHDVVEFRNSMRVVSPSRRRLQEQPERDLALSLPEGQPWLENADPKLNDFLGAAEDGSIIPFTPDCYTGDAVRHKLKMNVVFDFGTYTEITQGFSSRADKQEAVMREVEHQFGMGKLIYLSQINLVLEVVRVIVGSQKDEMPLSQVSNMYLSDNFLGGKLLKY